MSERFSESRFVDVYNTRLANPLEAQDVIKLDKAADFEDQTVEVHGEKQDVSVLVVRGESNKTIIANVAWSDDVRRQFERRRLAAMSYLTGATVIGISFPGMGVDRDSENDKLTQKQIKDLSGDNDDKKTTFSSVGEASWKAVKKVLGAEDKAVLTNNEVYMMNYSLGANTGAGMLASLPKNVKLARVGWIENTDEMKKTKYRSLRNKFFRHGPKEQGKYLKMNHDNILRSAVDEAENVSEGGWTWVKRALLNRKQRRQSKLIGRAIANSSIEYDIKLAESRGNAFKDSEQLILRGEGSKVSSDESDARLAAVLKRSLNRGTTIEKAVIPGEFHSMRESFAINAAIGARILGLSLELEGVDED